METTKPLFYLSIGGPGSSHFPQLKSLLESSCGLLACCTDPLTPAQTKFFWALSTIKHKMQYLTYLMGKHVNFIFEDTEIQIQQWDGFPGPQTRNMISQIKQMSDLRQMLASSSSSSCMLRCNVGLRHEGQEYLFHGSQLGFMIYPDYFPPMPSVASSVDDVIDYLVRPFGHDDIFSNLHPDVKTFRTKAFFQLCQHLVTSALPNTVTPVDSVLCDCDSCACESDDDDDDDDEDAYSLDTIIENDANDADYNNEDEFDDQEDVLEDALFYSSDDD